ncbi:branched-chain amino acid ABC transporter permease [Halovenus sp. WSH3]|uniref:Branched-chain amino acid ABC transporter permease n=1 Tax=Halovenus carboxidivorans TaxID=2692199 RepID=A0A6B0T076_9EURY|nr:AzlC family ABC transporter permease [Halovenus carboxidivorans]MXR51374.1 branched-chain amino acid ABC transporter permease [Halovenus carboxidivorans]
MSRREDFIAGVRTTTPVMLGVIPFGLVAGAAAVGAGLSLLQAIALSVVVFAGASQLAMIELLGQDATLLVVVGTALIINSRLVMYSASLAPHFTSESRRWRGLMAYIMTDQAFALSVTRYAEGMDDVTRRRWYYLGTAAPLWVVWQICTVVGVAVGASVPGWLPLRFAVPLTFLALLVPAVQTRAHATAAVVGGGVATAGATIPYNLGLVLGALLGVAAGTLVARTASEPAGGVGPEEVGE